MENKQHICASVNCTHSSHYKPLVHVHLHSSGSTDGVAKIKDYVQLAKDFNHPAIALTDHGSGHMLFDFYKECKNAGIKPILGEEFYFTTNINTRIPSKQRILEEKDKHGTVLIKNAEGYKNYCKLTYLSFTDGFYFKPRIEYDMLFENKKGLIVTTGCAASIFNQLLNAGEATKAEEWFKRFVLEFGENFYGEIQFNELREKDKWGIDQKQLNDFIIEMCTKYDIKVLIAGDVHYAQKEDTKLQDIVIGAMMRKPGKEVDENKESFVHAKHLYYHNSDDFFFLNKEFGYNYDNKFIEQCFENSIELKDKINFEFETGKINFPKYNTNIVGKTNLEVLSELAFNGLFNKLTTRRDRGEKFDDKMVDTYKERLEYELKIIDDKKIVDYFLIVQDVINWAKQSNIRVGVSRGSCGGSLLAYATNITELDPIPHKLLFERFINPDRTALPDIDCDFAQGARESVRKYLEEKYGKESVLGVVTFGQYKAKSALQDTARGLGLDTSFASVLIKEISKLEDLEDQKDLEKYFSELKKKNTSINIQTWISENEETIKWANKLIGQIKQLGTHAGGILITPGPVYDFIPVTRGGKEVVTAFKEADGSSKDLSELGLLKLDILGVKTLNVIQNCIDNIKTDLNIDIANDIQFPNLVDPKLYEMVRKRNVLGVFQMDGGAGKLINSIQPSRFQDIVAISSLNRPGPSETFGPVYAKWKKHFENGTPELCKEDEEIFPRLDFMQEVTRDNYFCMIHQEDFMFMVAKAADFNLGEADNFRRAIAWRKDNPKYHTVEKYFKKLEDGMLKKGYSKDDVDYFVEYCRKFSGYSFNLSHSCAYSIITIQCLYLKVYYPAYFYVNLLNVEEHEAYQDIVSDALAQGIKILPPSVKNSKYNFSVEEGNIRIGLKALKGFGEIAYNELEALKVSETNNIYEVLSLPFKKVNTAAFTTLINAGCFDVYGIEREKIAEVRNLFNDKKIEKWFTRKRGTLTVETKPESLMQFSETIINEILEKIKESELPWTALVQELIPHVKVKLKSEQKKEDEEQELLGFSLSLSDKLNKMVATVEEYKDLGLKCIADAEQGDLCYWYLLNKTVAKTKTGKEYLILEMTDKQTTIKAKLWDKINVEKGKAYVSRLRKDMYGYQVINDDFLTQI